MHRGHLNSEIDFNLDHRNSCLPLTMMHQSLSKPLYGQIGVPNNLTGKGTGFPLDLENLENLEK